MRKILMATALLLPLTLTVATPAFAAEFTKGVIKKVNLKKKKVTIIHEELVDLEMPAMTMVFRVSDETMLDGLEKGDEVEFIAERTNGKLTVTEFKND
jgi:Cu/Ag efflux protein CusF